MSDTHPSLPLVPLSQAGQGLAELGELEQGRKFANTATRKWFLPWGEEGRTNAG